MLPQIVFPGFAEKNLTMKKKSKLKVCNWSLLAVASLMLVSAIWLEATGSRGATAVRIHIALGIIMMALVAWHIFLHFGKSNWFGKLRKLKAQFTRVLWWVAMVAFASGIVATVLWLLFAVHSPIGGVHGKIGFILLLLSVVHIAKRFKFFRGKSRRGCRGGKCRRAA